MGSMSKRALTEAQVADWRSRGAIELKLPASIMAPALDWLNKNFTLAQVDVEHLDFGTPDRQFEFPTKIAPLDDLVLSEYLITAVQQLLGTEDIRLLQADLWPKVGVAADTHDAQANTDQRMHMDYGNNMLLHPEWNAPEAVAAVVYYDDATITAGGTAYVLREGDDDPVYQPPYIAMPGQAGVPFANDRRSVEAWFKANNPDVHQLRQTLYEREQQVVFQPGTILFYRHDLWHRGTPVTPGALRRVHNLGWRRADARGWTNWNEGWARASYYGDVEALIGRATPLQRSLLDMPMPGDPYWTEKRVRMVEARFGHYGFDASPYLDALPEQENKKRE